MGVDTFSGSFNANQLHVFLIQKMVKRASGIAPATHAGNDPVRVFFTGLFLELPADFFGNDRLKPGNHVGIRMRPNHRTDDVVRVNRVVNPVAHGLVGGIFQGLIATEGRNHFRSEHLHLFHVRRLALHINGPHVNNTFQTHQRANRCGCQTVLSGAGFSNNPMFAQFFCDQNLANRVVYFVRSGMVQILAFQINVALVFFRKPPGIIQRRGPPNVIFEQANKFLPEIVRIDNFEVFQTKFFDVWHHHFRNVGPAKLAVIPFFVNLIIHILIFKSPLLIPPQVERFKPIFISFF